MKAKPFPGHRCKGATMSVRVSCECGWSSAHWSGSGARRSAYGEFRWHIEQQHKAAQP